MVLSSLQDHQFRCLLALCSVILYVNTFRAGYVWDDRAAIIGNKDVTQEASLLDVFRHDFWGQDISNDLSHKSYRPVTTLSFRINHMIHGLHASGYHVANVFIYALTVVLTYELGLRLMSKGAARFSSLLFCFHPIHVEAVASLVGRADSLCGVFYISAILAYVSCLNATSSSLRLFQNDSQHTVVNVGGVNASFVVALLLAVAAGFSKEIGVTVLGVFPCFEVCAQINRHRQQYLEEKKALSGNSYADFMNGFSVCLRGVSSAFFQLSSSLIRTAIVLILLIVLMRVRVYVNGETKVYEWTILENHILHLPTLKERALSYAQSHFWYFFKLCFPRYLCFDYGFACIPTIHKFSDPRNVFPFFTYAVLLRMVIYAITHIHVPLIAATVMLIVPLIPALNIFIPVGTTLAERLLFLPSLGFCFICGLVVVEECQHVWNLREGKGTWQPRLNRGSVALHGVLALVCGLSAVRVISRNIDWNSEVQIYDSALIVCPLSAKALANYAVLSNFGKTRHKAVISALSATDVYKEQSPAFLNTGVALERLGMSARAVWYFEKAVTRRGGHVGKTYAYLGHALYDWSLHYPQQRISNNALPTSEFEGGRDPVDSLRSMAMQAMDEAFRLRFGLPTLYQARGSLALDTGDLSFAVQCFDIAIEKTQAAKKAAADVPREDLVDEVVAYNGLGNAYSYMNDYDRAIAAFERGVEYALATNSSSSNYVSLLVNFGSTLRSASKLRDARMHLKRGLEYLQSLGEVPSPALLNNLGLVEQDLGSLDAAERYMEEAIEVNQRVLDGTEETSFMMRSTGNHNGNVDTVHMTLQENLRKLRLQIAGA